MASVALLDAAQLKNGEMKEVDYEGGKILLSKTNDKVHATSAFCTHYGAPLAKGVLTSDGRVVCPWHGACFNTCTGDIEDAPAISPIHSFSVSIQDGKIHVTIPEKEKKNVLKENKSRYPNVAETVSAATGGKGVVVVGGGAGGLNTIESLREHGYTGPITLISKEPHAPIDRTKLSKALIDDASKVEWRKKDELEKVWGVKLILGTTATKVDTSSKTVTTESGDTYSYESLVLSPGAIARRLPIPGADVGFTNVHTLRGIADVKSILTGLKEGAKLVIIGSSFIGLELADAASSRKLASIDVIGREDYPFASVLGKDVGKALKPYYEAKKITFHPKAQITGIHASASDPSKAGAVELSDKKLEADIVVLGVGAAPATEFLKTSGFALEKDGGVKVDEYLRVKGLEAGGVYAIGDIAHYPVPGQDAVRRIEHWNVASNHGRAVGRNIAQKPEPFVKVPIFWSSQGLRYCGNGVGFEDVIFQKHGEGFAAFYVIGEKIIAVASWKKDPLNSHCAELLRLGLMPTATEIRNGKDPLSIKP